MSSSPTDIGVLTVMIGYTDWQTRLVEDNRVHYCKRHGYGNHFLTQLVPAISNHTFGKFGDSQLTGFPECNQGFVSYMNKSLAEVLQGVNGELHGPGRVTSYSC